MNDMLIPNTIAPFQEIEAVFLFEAAHFCPALLKEDVFWSDINNAKKTLHYILTSLLVECIL